MAKVSIIVPVSNAEEYVLKCLESLREQSFSDIKIICIENGSTDNSWRAISSQKSDKRVVAIKVPHAEVSYARNLGLFWALKFSPYVMFCDADDTYDKYMVEAMVSGIEENHTDLCCCEIAVDYHTDYELKESDDEYYSLKFEGINTNIKDVINEIDYSLCDKIFRASIIRKHSLTFPNSLHYEDACFCWKYLSVTDSIFFIKKKLYHYVRHENSIMNNTFSKSARSIDHIRIADNIYDFLYANNLVESFKEQFARFYASYLSLARIYCEGHHIGRLEKINEQFEKKFFSKDE